MHPKRIRSRRGVGMMVVLGMVVAVTMLGFAGLRMAEKDNAMSGSLLDIRTAEDAAQAGVDLAIGRILSNPAAAIRQINGFLDSAKKVRDGGHAEIHSGFNFEHSTEPFTMVDIATVEPFQLGNTPAKVRVELLAVDLGGPQGSENGDGILLKLRSEGWGRRGDPRAVIGTYRLQGVDVPGVQNNTLGVQPTAALNLQGELSNTNIGQDIEGDVYIGGNAHLNQAAGYRIKGRLRVNGDFTSDAPLSVSRDAIISGRIYTNGDARLSFDSSVTVFGGLDVMNAGLVVRKNLTIWGKPAALPSWNHTGSLLVGGQLWFKDQRISPMADSFMVDGNAYFDQGFKFRGDDAALYLFKANFFSGVAGVATPVDEVQGLAKFAIKGVAGFYGNGLSIENGASTLVSIGSNASFTGPVSSFNGTRGQLWIGGNAQFNKGFARLDLKQNDLVRVDGNMFVRQNPVSNASYSGAVQLGTGLYLYGDLDPNFGLDELTRWWFPVGKTGKWLYESINPNPNPDERVTRADRNLKTARTNRMPVWPVLGRTDPLLNLVAEGDDPAEMQRLLNPDSNKPLEVRIDKDSAAEANSKILTYCEDGYNPFSTDRCFYKRDIPGHTGANLTTDDFTKIYQAFATNANNLTKGGYLVLRFPVGITIDPPASGKPTTFEGKMMVIAEGNLIVNGHWPSSKDSTDIQLIYLTEKGYMTQFGTLDGGDFWGYVHIGTNCNEAGYGGGFQFKFDRGGTIHGAITVANPSCIFRFNQPDDLSAPGVGIILSQSVFDDISVGLPGVLKDPNGRNKRWIPGPVTTSEKIVVRDEFLRVQPISTFHYNWGLKNQPGFW